MNYMVYECTDTANECKYGINENVQSERRWRQREIER